MQVAEKGIVDLRAEVDTLLIIPNQNLFRIANKDTTFAEAFHMADRVLYSGVRGITDLMVMPGLINLDFADVRTVMAGMGSAMMGEGEGEGENRALKAAKAAIANPLLDDVSMRGAKGVLINITGGYDMTLFEVDEAANEIRREVDVDAHIILGSTFDEKMNGKIRVSVVAAGLQQQAGGPPRAARDARADCRRALRRQPQRAIAGRRARPHPHPPAPSETGDHASPSAATGAGASVILRNASARRSAAGRSAHTDHPRASGAGAILCAASGAPAGTTTGVGRAGRTFVRIALRLEVQAPGRAGPGPCAEAMDGTEAPPRTVSRKA